MSFKIIPVFFMPVMVSEEVYKISKKEINYVKKSNGNGPKVLDSLALSSY